MTWYSSRPMRVFPLVHTHTHKHPPLIPSTDTHTEQDTDNFSDDKPSPRSLSPVEECMYKMNIIFEDRFEFLSTGGELGLATFPLEEYSSSPGGHSWTRGRIHERTISLS
jgi:hypothetical protein